MSKQCAKGTDCGKEVEYTLSENVAKCLQSLTGLPEDQGGAGFSGKGPGSAPQRAGGDK